MSNWRSPRHSCLRVFSIEHCAPRSWAESQSKKAKQHPGSRITHARRRRPPLSLSLESDGSTCWHSMAATKLLLTRSTMKLSSPLSLLAFCSSASAWTTAASTSRHLSRAVLRREFAAAALFSYSTVEVGEVDTESFRLKFKVESDDISPWHDIPFEGEKGYNMLVEIPKMTKAKMEVATKEEQNPIAQDIKKGKLRDYHGPIFWNYGCIPQTWEDPNQEHPELKVFGDDDPIDVVEIGSKVCYGTHCVRRSIVL